MARSDTSYWLILKPFHDKNNNKKKIYNPHNSQALSINRRRGQSLGGRTE